jgi:hypothetical protein
MNDGGISKREVKHDVIRKNNCFMRMLLLFDTHFFDKRTGVNPIKETLRKCIWFYLYNSCHNTILYDQNFDGA